MSPLVHLLVGTAVAAASVAWMAVWLFRFMVPFWAFPGVREARAQEEPPFGQTNAVAIQAKVALAAVALAWGAIQVSEALARM